MKKIFILALMAILFASCAEKTKEDYIKEAFEAYVETDFADPSEYIEITSITAKDTINNEFALSLVGQMEAIKVLFTNSQITEIAEYKERIINDKTEIIEYLLKVRIEHNGRKSIREFYVIDDGFDYKVQEREMTINDLPELYKEFYTFAYELIN